MTTPFAPLPLHVSDLRVDALGRTLLAVDRLAVEPGEAVAVTGPSGAGKSTLLHALAGLNGATGRIAWGETSLLALAPAARTRFRGRHMGLVFQDHLLFEELDARANAAIVGAFRADPAIARRADDLLERLAVPRGRRDARTFSGGERGRIAVARALAHDPAVVLADEPTASLDRLHADRLTADLVALTARAGRTLVVVTHDERLRAACDRTVALADGRLA